MEHKNHTVQVFACIIQNPASEQDSLFAIIDLAYTYQLMQQDTTNRNFYLGRYPKYNYSNYDDFAESREFHLSLLHGYANNNNNPEHYLATGNHELRCYPNPFTDLIQVESHSIQGTKNTIKIFNGLGQKIFESVLPNTNQLEISTIDLKNYPKGLFFIVLEADRKVTGSQKVLKL